MSDTGKLIRRGLIRADFVLVSWTMLAVPGLANASRPINFPVSLSLVRPTRAQGKGYNISSQQLGVAVWCSDLEGLQVKQTLLG